jgi:hypothetical protein
MKIRLAAIAKDEGAYLAEWIYWHLKQGFDDIYICINNTTDNSAEIAQAIASKYDITVEVVDTDTQYGFNDKIICPSFLKRNPLQSRLYADIYTRSYSEGYTHVMFLDIDEFFFYKNGSIHQLIKNEPDYDVILFNWFNISGESNAFSNLNHDMKGERSPFTKYLMRTGLSDIQFISTHNIQTTHSKKALFGRGLTSDNRVYLAESGWCDQAFILHRHLRSQSEYLSLLGRGDTWNNSLIGLKNNRDGWTTYGTYSIPIDRRYHFSNYKNEFKQFLSNCEISEQIIVAQENVLARAKMTEELISNVRNLNYDLDRVLAGTNLRHIDRTLKYKIKSWLYRVTLQKNITPLISLVHRK